MKTDLNAFISYRRDDAFCHPGDAEERDLSFIRRLRAALLMSGFTDVFVDIDKISTMDDFKQRIRTEIKNSDLFVAVIGHRWLEILQERKRKGEGDVLVREVRTALRNEKEILPITVDRAPMPAEGALKGVNERIEDIHNRQALHVARDEPLETLVASLIPVYAKVAADRRRRDFLRRGYIAGAAFTYFVCAILIHIVGYLEYGVDAWQRMAQIWAGFFLWPIVCLPFALVALYRPLTVIFHFAGGTGRLKEGVVYLVPLFVGLAVTILAIVVEVLGEYETPWTINPTLSNCSNGRARVASDYDALARYDGAGGLASKYTDRPFWLADKCWPNALFYLIEPAYRKLDDREKDAQYIRERPEIETTFVRLLNRKSTSPYSYVFYVYVLSFSLQIWLAATGIILAIFYVTRSVRRPIDGRVLKLPSEDIYICLTYAFLTLMLWIPFRLNTVHLKKLYFCSDFQSCAFDTQYYQNDIVLGTMFFLGYVYLIAGLLRKFRRFALSFIGIMAVLGTIGTATLVVVYAEAIARMTESWQFYLRVLIVLLAILFALWMQFDPERVHARDEEREDADHPEGS